MAESESPAPKPGRRILWSALAVVLAAVVLIAVVATRLLPPGTRMAENSVGGSSPIGPTCTHYPGAEVSIVAPAAGRIVVSATVGIGIDHMNAIGDIAQVAVAATSTECDVNNYTSFVSVPTSLPTNRTYFETVPLLRPFSVPSAGSYTFYVNAAMAQGWDVLDRFDSASMVAVYYAN